MNMRLAGTSKRQVLDQVVPNHHRKIQLSSLYVRFQA